jgi:hypothetical protein
MIFCTLAVGSALMTFVTLVSGRSINIFLQKSDRFASQLIDLGKPLGSTILQRHDEDTGERFAWRRHHGQLPDRRCDRCRTLHRDEAVLRHYFPPDTGFQQQSTPIDRQPAG